MLPNLTPVQIARFWSKLGPPDASGCRFWLGQRNAYQYGRFLANSRRLLAHRVAYQLTYGPIPSWLFVCHLCDQRGCCEPTHLVAADHAWNMFDRGRKGRTASGDRNASRSRPERLKRGDEHPAKVHGGSYFARGDDHPARIDSAYLPRGSRHGMAKLTETIVREARARYAAGGVSYESLAIEAGVSLQAMWNAVRGASWKHL